MFTYLFVNFQCHVVLVGVCSFAKMLWTCTVRCSQYLRQKAPTNPQSLSLLTPLSCLSCLPLPSHTCHILLTVSFHPVSCFCLLKCYSILPSQTVPHMPLSILPQLSHLFLSTSCLSKEVPLLFHLPRCSSWRQEKEVALDPEDGEWVCPGKPGCQQTGCQWLQRQWNELWVHQEPVRAVMGSHSSRTPRSRREMRQSISIFFKALN